MSAFKLLDGKAIAEIIKDEIATEVRKLIKETGNSPHLAAILVGEDPASETYIASKERACKEVGFISTVYRLESSVSEAKLLDVIDFVNHDDEIDGFIVQLPLPKGFNTEKIIERIKPSKDVDGFHPINLGRMMQNMPCYLPATPQGIMELIERYNIPTEGKSCAVIGRSQIVGTPMSVLMSRKGYPGNATVTLCHSYTKDLVDITRNADILIAAIGQQGFVKADMVKEGAVVIDVGIHRVPSSETKSGFRLMGDVDFAEVSKKAGFITPVPGGVGLLTVVSLLQNTLKAHKKLIYK